MGLEGKTQAGIELQNKLNNGDYENIDSTDIYAIEVQAQRNVFTQSEWELLQSVLDVCTEIHYTKENSIKELSKKVESLGNKPVKKHTVAIELTQYELDDLKELLTFADNTAYDSIVEKINNLYEGE